jgi:cobalamin biosynthesis Mg chelatase CobN
MTFEEIQEILNGMLKIQQDIQIKQLKNTDAIAQINEQQEKNVERIARIDEQQEKNVQAIALLTENISNLNVVSQRHENRLTQLYGYQQTADSDRLNIMQGVLDIKRKLSIIEERLDAR